MKGKVLRIAVVYPDLLGTYGDGGNGLVLARRAAWRGIEVELLQATSDQALPLADLYCLGGGEDGPQVQAAESLQADGRLVHAVDEGAVVLAVCAGFQIVGTAYPGADGASRPGLGLLDATTVKGTGRRAVGELLAEPLALDGATPALPLLTGFENHGGVTTLGPATVPLARVTVGTGNGGGDGTEGARRGRVLATYLHGPVLARNPALADLLLSWALDREEALAPLDDDRVRALRQERVVAATRRRRLWAGR